MSEEIKNTKKKHRKGNSQRSQEITVADKKEPAKKYKSAKGNEKGQPDKKKISYSQKIEKPNHLRLNSNEKNKRNLEKQEIVVQSKNKKYPSKIKNVNFNSKNDKRQEEITESKVTENKISDRNRYNLNIPTTRASEAKEKNEKINNKKGACPHIKECGSCRMMQVSYGEHLKEKLELVKGLISKFCKVEPILGMKEPKHYRNKVHVVFDHDKKGNPISGIYEEGTHRVIPIDSCIIHNEKADEIIRSIRGMLKSFKIKTYDEDTGYGLLRHVLIRTGFTSGEIMVVLVLSSPILPSKNNFVKALRQLHPEITTIVLNVNDKKTSMVLGEKEHVIFGKGYIEDTLCEKVFRISPKSFYQVNPAQTEVIYRKAIELAELKGTETVIDAYCGIGTIGLIASDHANKVIGVELNKDAVKDAITNAKRNQITNVDFYNQDAGEFMRQLAEQKVTIDTVFMDPPRAGSDEMFLDSIAALKPGKVIYISCNPVTLERDLLYLTKKGYKAVKAIPVDMFPWTAHVETVVEIVRK